MSNQVKNNIYDVDRIATLNTVSKYIDSNGILQLDDILGAYHRLGYEPIDRSRIDELNRKAEYLERYDDNKKTDSDFSNDSTIEFNTSGLLNVDEAKLSDFQKSFDELKNFSELELRRLSKALNENDYVIPDDYKIVIYPIELEGEVFTQSSASRLGFILELHVGRARIRLSNTILLLKNRLHDVINGAIIMASSCIRFRE